MIENGKKWARLDSALKDLGLDGNDILRVHIKIRELRKNNKIKVKRYLEIGKTIEAICWDGSNFDDVANFLGISDAFIDDSGNFSFYAKGNSNKKINCRYPKGYYIYKYQNSDGTSFIEIEESSIFNNRYMEV